MRLCGLRLRLRVRWRRALTDAGRAVAALDRMDEWAAPTEELLVQQADWLAPARAQLWRRVHIARRRSILDLGTGHGAVVPELVRRGRGRVVAVDRLLDVLHTGGSFVGAHVLAGDAIALPFSAGAFDLVLSQLVLLWVVHADQAIAEIWRVLAPGGVLVALEPDYGGIIEYPPDVATRSLWLQGLERAGADPYIGRRLPGLLARVGFEVHVGLFDTLFPPDETRFEFLKGLPLTPEEEAEQTRRHCAAKKRTGTWEQVAHLPFFLVRATKPER